MELTRDEARRIAANNGKPLEVCGSQKLARWEFSMMTDTNDEFETEMPPNDTNGEEIETRPDLVWDKEAPGLCVRAYGNGSKLFILVYRVDDRQRFVRIGKSPTWSLEAARKRAKELRAVIDQGGDPETYNHERDKVRPGNHERDKVRPVEDVIRYIAEELGRKP